MKPQSCYPNAIKKVQDVYQNVEGVITSKNSGDKISHAWNINSNGRRIDFTILGTHNYLYHGIIIHKKILREIAFQNGGIWYCSLPYLSIVI